MCASLWSAFDSNRFSNTFERYSQLAELFTISIKELKQVVYLIAVSDN